MEERKYNNISKEDLEKVLIKAGVFCAWEPKPENDISRIVVCEALGQIFQIEWWINQCYLLIDHLKMPFHWVRVDTTWPWWEYRRELHFENSLRRPFEPSNLVAVLGIEYSAEYFKRHKELRKEKTMDRVDEIIRMFQKAECPKEWEKCPVHVAGNDCDNYCPFEEAADMLIDYKKIKPDGDQCG